MGDGAAADVKAAGGLADEEDSAVGEADDGGAVHGTAPCAANEGGATGSTALWTVHKEGSPGVGCRAEAQAEGENGAIFETGFSNASSTARAWRRNPQGLFGAIFPRLWIKDQIRNAEMDPPSPSNGIEVPKEPREIPDRTSVTRADVGNPPLGLAGVGGLVEDPRLPERGDDASPRRRPFVGVEESQHGVGERLAPLGPASPRLLEVVRVLGRLVGLFGLSSVGVGVFHGVFFDLIFIVDDGVEVVVDLIALNLHEVGRLVSDGVLDLTENAQVEGLREV